MRAQVSVEFLIIIGMIMVLILPVIIYAFSVLNVENQDRIDSVKAEAAIDRIAYTVDSVGSAGTGSALYTNIFVSSVENVSVEKNEVKFMINTADGPVELYRVTQYNLTSDGLDKIKVGEYKLLINATNSTTVNIKVV
ncbi:hypothetical protein J7J90_04405 [Candidatus Micrarchaeota archaeon]|nr:hypothetical protein [Candidatus Micrarchaeota archaeon]